MFKKRAKGGKRVGAGRKPKAATLLRRELAQHGADEAQKSFDWLCEWRDDEDQPIMIRVECAKEIMNRVLGRPKQSIELSGDEHKPISIKAIDYRAVLAPLAPVSVLDGDSSGEGEDHQPGETSG